MSTEDIPPLVYYVDLRDDFYALLDGGSMGADFYAKWRSRRGEFPRFGAKQATKPKFGPLPE